MTLSSENQKSNSQEFLTMTHPLERSYQCDFASVTKGNGRDDPHSFWSTLLFALSVWSLQPILSPVYSPTIIIISHYVYRRWESRNKKWSQSSSFSSWLLSLIDRLPIAAPLVLVLTIIVARHSHPPRQQFVQIVWQFVSSFLNFFFKVHIFVP